MSDESKAQQAEQARVDPPEAGRDRQRDSSPSFSHAVNASSHFREMLMDEGCWTPEQVMGESSIKPLVDYVRRGGKVEDILP